MCPYALLSFRVFLHEVIVMAGISDLGSLLQSISPALLDDEFVSCTVQGKCNEY